jgi:hypothetical protein
MQAREIKALVPGAVCSGTVGRTSSFEVVVDDRFQLYSKLAKGVFPDFKALAKDVAAYAETGTAPATWAALK